jgi:hypothetical protein
MKFKILDFKKTERRFENIIPGQLVTVSDYWQWYTGGIESIINANDFIIVNRNENERTEVLTNKFYEDVNISDVLVLINNDNYLWDAPADWDLSQDIIDNKMLYYQRHHKVQMTEDEELYWKRKIEDKVIATRDVQDNIVVPIRGELQKVIRHMKEYLSEREVE